MRFTVCSVCHLVNTHTPAALQRTFQALYLLYKALHSGMRHVTFCCSKQLNRTFFMSNLTQPLFCVLQMTNLAEPKTSAGVPDVSDTNTDEVLKESTDSVIKTSTARDDDDVKDDSALSAAAADVTKTSRNAEKKKAKKQKVVLRSVNCNNDVGSY